MNLRNRNMSTMVMENPNSGEMSSDMPIFRAWLQSIAASFTPGSSEYASPTPRIEPISVWELEQGMPRYQVSRFQAMALSSKAMTMDRLWAIF